MPEKGATMNDEVKPIRFLAPAGIAFAVAFVVGFIVSHPRVGSGATQDVAKVPLGIMYGIVAAVITLIVQGVRRVMRRSRSATIVRK